MTLACVNKNDKRFKAVAKLFGDNITERIIIKLSREIPFVNRKGIDPYYYPTVKEVTNWIAANHEKQFNSIKVILEDNQYASIEALASSLKGVIHKHGGEYYITKLGNSSNVEVSYQHGINSVFYPNLKLVNRLVESFPNRFQVGPVGQNYVTKLRILPPSKKPSLPNGIFTELTDYSINNDITEGVSELFESNPELANTVYEALGFSKESDFKQTFKSSLWRGQESQPFIDENGNLVLTPTYDSLFKSEGISFAEHLSMAQEYGERYSKNPFIIEIDESYADSIYPLDRKGRSKDYGKRVVGDEREQRVVAKDDIVIPKGKFKIHKQKLNLNLSDVKTSVLLKKYQEQFTESDIAEYSRYGEIAKGYATEDPLVFEQVEQELLKRGITKKDLPFLIQNRLNGLEYNVAEALGITKEFTDNFLGKKINLPDESSVTQKDIDFYLSKVEEVENKLENKGTKNEIGSKNNTQPTPQQKQQAQQLYSQYLDSLNKPNTNPILQGNQQEQVKKFAELQERLNNKEFLEGAKNAFESSEELQNVYYEAVGVEIPTTKLEGRKAVEDTLVNFDVIEELASAERSDIPSSILIKKLLNGGYLPKINETDIVLGGSEYGIWRPNLKKIEAQGGNKSTLAKKVGHELLHSVTHNIIYSYQNLKGVVDFNDKYNKDNIRQGYIKPVNLTKSQIEALDNLVRIRNKVVAYIEQNKDKIQKQDRGFGTYDYFIRTNYTDSETDLHEFISEVFTNPELINILKEIPTEGKKSNLFKDFVQAIAKILGFNNTSILEDIIAYSEEAFFVRPQITTQQKQDALNAYTDYIARVSLGIVKNPSSGEYNYESKARDIVYHGSGQYGFDKFSKEKLGEFTGSSSAKLGFFFSNNLENSFAAYTINVNKDVSFSDEGDVEGVEGTFGLSQIDSLIEDLNEGRDFTDNEIRNKEYFIKSTSKSGGISYGIPFKTKIEALEDYKNDDWNYNPDAEVEIIENINYGKYKYSKIDWLKDKSVVYYKEELDKRNSKTSISEEEYNKALNNKKEYLLSERNKYIKEQSKNRVYNILLNSKDLKEFDDKGNQWREETYVDRIKQTLSENKDGLVIRNTYDPLLNDVYIVFEPEQIHILGSKQDIKQFKSWVDNNQTNVQYQKQIDLQAEQDVVLEEFANSLSERFNISFDLVSEEEAKSMLPKYTKEPAFFDPKTKKAYLVKGKANKNSAVHEIFTHPFLLQIEKTNPTLYKNLLKEAKNNKSIVDYVDNLYGTNQNNDHEYIARAIDLAVQGELDQQKDKTLLERIQDFFNQISDYLKKLFNVPKVFSSAISPNITLQQLTQFAMYGKGKMNLNPAQKNIEYSLKATNVIVKNLDKIKQWEKNKSIGEDILWNKIQELGIPKEQLELIKNSEGNTVEEKLLDFANEYSYTVEINTAKAKQGREKFDNAQMRAAERGEDYFAERDFYDEIEGIEREEIPTQHYSNLTVPGGTNYTENEISTPLITPSIKGHAQFATDNGIGWFRSDDKSNEIFTKENIPANRFTIPHYEDGSEVVYYKKDNKWYIEDKLNKDREISNEFIAEIYSKRFDKSNETSSKTRRILELQSDLFQKGRTRQLLTNDRDLESAEKEGAISGKEAMQWAEQLEKTTENQFLQLLNKNNNWVTFFVKSIIQDSAKKGYEKVLFPKGDTAAKIEGHQTLEEFKKQIEDRIKQISGKLIVKKNESDERGVWDIIDENNGLLIGNQFSEKAALDRIPELTKNRETEINQLKQELERVETEGFGALKPIYNFYENTVTNILKKQGYNPVEITDEYGNTWNEVTIDENRDNQNIVFQKTHQSNSFSQLQQSLNKPKINNLAKLDSNNLENISLLTENKIVNLVDNETNKPCLREGGKFGFTTGGKWEVLTKFKGASHEKGGIDIDVSNSKIKLTGKQGEIKAENGLIISNNII